ncbi:hypothetical protein AURDEDRAFT_115131 [Auricularia subglabra TFB-10046 SS5]|nr:hypothetical protein AURDEDRAFT_115131 [Auricularia subglabra TFB-10046 SS5]
MALPIIYLRPGTLSAFRGKPDTETDSDDDTSTVDPIVVAGTTQPSRPLHWFGVAPAILPSETWKEADEQNAAHPYWMSLHFEAIERVASACRDGLRCTANREKYAAGRHNIAIELVFQDGIVWIARLTTDHSELSPADIVRRIRCEVATLHILADKTIVPVPTIFAYSETQDNPIGCPYVLMSALEGYPPEAVGLAYTSSNQRIPEDKMPFFETFCDSLAEIFVQLGWIKFPTTGSINFLDANGGYVLREEAETHLGSCATSREYYTALAEHIERKAQLECYPDRGFGVWLVRTLLHARLENSEGPFSLTHRNLRIDNILVDKNGEITGILGWSTAACLPREFGASQAVDFVSPSALDAPDPERESWAQTFHAALKDVDPGLAQLRGSKAAKLLASLILCPPESYTSPEFLQGMCMVVWKRPNWERVKEEWPVLQWLLGGKKPGTKDEKGKGRSQAAQPVPGPSRLPMVV